MNSQRLQKSLKLKLKALQIENTSNNNTSYSNTQLKLKLNNNESSDPTYPCRKIRGCLNLNVKCPKDRTTFPDPKGRGEGRRSINLS